jgi:hypothetical protein
VTPAWRQQRDWRRELRNKSVFGVGSPGPIEPGPTVSCDSNDRIGDSLFSSQRHRCPFTPLCLSELTQLSSVNGPTLSRR